MQEDKSKAVKLSKYHHTRSEKFVGINKPFKSKSELVNRAVSDLLDDYESREVKN